jgi:hypothetical protein
MAIPQQQFSSTMQMKESQRFAPASPRQKANMPNDVFRQHDHGYDEWYEGKNNWNECKMRMGAELGQVKRQFTGDKVDRPVYIEPTQLDKVKDALYYTMNEPPYLDDYCWRNPVEQRLVYDYFWDHDFPPDNSYWYRSGMGADCIEEYRQPTSWVRLSDLGGLASPYVPALNEVDQNPPPDKLYQGALEDFYLVQACYALSTKSKLVRDIFSDGDYSSFNKLGMYQLRFYKHAQWTRVCVDDYMPFDKDGQPLCCKGAAFPSFAWASLVEKAYAKMHHSWEAISGGGCVEEVMTDLTGGCSGRFHTTDVAGDRLWKYFQLLGRQTVWGCGINEGECSKRLIPIGKHYASAVYAVTQHESVPYIGVFTSAPYSAVKHFPVCHVPMPQGYDYTNGFMWLRVDDFAQLFDAIYECRLVNTDINLLEPVPGLLSPGDAADRLPTPGYDKDSPWFEKIFAYHALYNKISAMNTPSFLFDVPEPHTEIIMDAGQTCNRFFKHHINPANNMRHEQAPLLVRFLECSNELLFKVDDYPREGKYMADCYAAGEVYLVHMSAWAHTRDAMCCVKVLRPGRYVAMVSMPPGYAFERMTFRVYSDKQVGVRHLEGHKNLMLANPGAPLAAIPYSLTGIPRIAEYRDHLPRMFDDEEGRGGHYGPTIPDYQMRMRNYLGGDLDDEPRQKPIGNFGGPGGGGSTAPVEKFAGNPCAFM